MDLADTFRQVTSHCLFDNYTNTTASNTSITLHKECLKSNKSIEHLLGNQSVTMRDCRMNNNVFYSKEVIKQMKEDKILLPSQGMNDYLKMVLRILLNPARDIQRFIRQFQREHYNNDNCIVGVQVRTGGCYGNNQETTEMMSKEEIMLLPQFVNTTIRSEYCPRPVIFLSTDSNDIEKYIKRELNYYPVYTTNLRRAHTGGRATIDSVRGAMTDLILLADSDILITNSESGFGTIASTLTRANKKVVYKVTHRKLEKEEYENCLKKRPVL